MFASSVATFGASKVIESIALAIEFINLSLLILTEPMSLLKASEEESVGMKLETLNVNPLVTLLSLSINMFFVKPL